MKKIVNPSNRFALIVGVAILGGLLTVVPNSEVSALGSWSYPKSEDERVKREEILEKQLLEQEEKFRLQHDVVTEKKGKLADLEKRIKLAKVALNFSKKPLAEALEKYRKVQSLSLLDPMVSTEPQRMELIEVKQETAAKIEEQKEKLRELEEQLPNAHAQVKIAMEHHKFILKEIDSLMRHRDAVRELVFVRTVAD